MNDRLFDTWLFGWVGSLRESPVIPLSYGNEIFLQSNSVLINFVLTHFIRMFLIMASPGKWTFLSPAPGISYQRGIIVHNTHIIPIQRNKYMSTIIAQMQWNVILLHSFPWHFHGRLLWWLGLHCLTSLILTLVTKPTTIFMTLSYMTSWSPWTHNNIHTRGGGNTQLL